MLGFGLGLIQHATQTLTHAATTVVASTFVGKSYIKSYLEEHLGSYQEIATIEIVKLKSAITNDKAPIKELNEIIVKIERRVQSLFSFIKADAQLNLFADIISKKIGDYESTEAFKTKLKNSPAVGKMKTTLLGLISPEIYQLLSSAVEKTGNVKNLKREEQEALVVLLKSDKITKDFNALNLKKTLPLFRQHVKALYQELGLAREDSDRLEQLINKLESDHLKDFENIKSHLQSSLPTLLEELLAYVYKECPHLQIESAPKAITIAKDMHKDKDKGKEKKGKEKKGTKRSAPEKEEAEHTASTSKPGKKKKGK